MQNLTELTGFIAAILTTFSFVPQVLHVWRTRSVADISLGMYSAYTFGIAIWLVMNLIVVPLFETLKDLNNAASSLQQLLEIETYRMAALLGLPAARSAGSVLIDAEKELAELAHAIQTAAAQDEASLLDRLTRLAGEVEGQYASTHSRFSASRAYFELVDRRISDISESRIHGLQTIADFMDRRLSPARSTCEWASRRQTALSERVSRMSNLLRTRVTFEQQQNSQQFYGFCYSQCQWLCNR